MPYTPRIPPSIIFLCLAMAAGCAAAADADGNEDDDASDVGGNGGSGGAGAGGGSVDDDAGPPWDGSAPGTEFQRVASGVQEGKSWNLADGSMVFHRYRGDVVEVMSPPAFVAENIGAFDDEGEARAAGDAVVFWTGSSTNVSAWSRTAGARLLTEMPVTGSGVASFATKSGDGALLVATDGGVTQRVWLVSATLDAVGLPSDDYAETRCSALESTLVCVASKGSSGTIVFASSGEGITELSLIPATEQYTLDPPVVGAHAIYVQVSQQIYEVPRGGGAAAVVPGATEVYGPFEDDYVVLRTTENMLRQRSDGEGRSTFGDSTTGPGYPLLYELYDFSRYTQFPVCDYEGTQGRNLRLVHLGTGDVTPLTEGCKLSGITYSDQHAVVMDPGLDSSNPGVPTHINLVTGDRKTFDLGCNGSGAYAWAIERSELHLWCPNLQWSYYDANTTSETVPWLYGPPLGQTTDVQPAGNGFLFKSRDGSGTYDIYFLPRSG